MGWKKFGQQSLAVALLTVGQSAIGLAPSARAEVSTARIAQQFGVSYLPLTVMKVEHLWEKRAKDEGLDLKVEWLRFSAGSGMNEALLSGSIDIASGGVGPMLTIWGKTVNNMKIKGIAALNSMPLDLVTTDPAVKTIKDFTAKDRIALPAVKTSIQAVTLQMAAAKAFGKGQENKLDALTVSMGHPDAETAMLGGHSEIDAHFGSPPFQQQELEDPRAHKVLDSYEVLGGPHTFNTVWATTKFVDNNPKVVDAFVKALDDAEAEIIADPQKVAALWVKAEGVKMSVPEIVKIIRDPQNEWTTTPKKILAYLDFMNQSGLVTAKTNDWRDVFFANIHKANGS